MLNIVKLGGSLYDQPRLGVALQAWLETLRGQVLIVPGGGGLADAIRDLDRIHQLGEEAAHWLALRATAVAAQFVNQLLPDAVNVRQPGNVFNRGILDVFEFVRLDDAFSGSLPHTWDVTIDSVAARAAAVFRADRFILLKSTDILPGCSWEAAAEFGQVDRHFPKVVKAHQLEPESMNFKRWIEDTKTRNI